MLNVLTSADKYNPNWWIDKFDMPEDVKKKIYSASPSEISSTWEGKAMMCIWFEDLYSILNSLGLCFFQSGINIALGPTHLSRMLSAATGWNITPQDLMIQGERIFTMLKAYIVREGLTPGKMMTCLTGFIQRCYQRVRPRELLYQEKL